ncbi:anaerobic selenocysteine-containing dehydrogenase [Nonomuraea thailandensis]|uniref:Anaerobic selenocysteine-containing dehydrogenase n=1 Tax=Nonomuraea thailandensis TaxID=1188745 RepID=A0A9X2H0V7_9ACTN|nr:anaerobic selenocysteine-containing dehydrogenase [Nonomuraea thailandensis]
MVTVENGRAVKMRGNPDQPYTRGALCVKVNRYLEHTQAQDRLLYPLRRTGPKGSGQFERITWEEALDEISVRLRAIVEEHGGEAIWPYLGTGTLGYLQGCEGVAGRRFWNLLGASRHWLNICSAAGNAGLRRTLGTAAGMDPENFALSKLILLWGTNTLTSGHHLWKFIQDARADGAYVVAIDPVRTRTADQADEHLAIRPGTDGALALGLLNVVLSENAQDEEFLAEHTEGWDDFREEILRHPVERVAEITGIPAEAVHRLGMRLAHTRPTALRATHGLQRHAGGGAALRVIAAIPGVTGDWRHPGGGMAFSTSDHVHLNVDRRDDLLAAPVRTLTMTKAASQLESVKCFWVYAANPVGSSPDSNAIRRQLLREDLFTVVMEHFPTDTVDYADIVLPATMQTEHHDLHAGYGHMYLLWNEQAVRPPGECLSTTETFRRLAAHMGMTEPSLYDSDLELAEQLLTSGHPSLEGITLDRLRKEGWARMNYPRPFTPFAEGFPTPSGRLRFPPAGKAYVPSYTAASRPSPGESSPYPLTLVTPASHTFLNTTFGNNPELLRRAKEPTVLVNPADAAARGLEDGRRVRVHNDGGEFLADVEISDRVAAGVVATPKGRWPKLSPGGANPNAVVAERDADMGRGPGFHDNFVEISPA